MSEPSSTVSDETRLRTSKVVTSVAGVGIALGNLAVAVETIVMVRLVQTGGGSGFFTDDLDRMWALLFGLIVGVFVGSAVGIAVLHPQMAWYVSGKPADARRRRMITRLPLLAVLSTGVAWVAGLIAYLVASIPLALSELAITGVSFLLAGLSSGCITYVVMERAMRPVTAYAMQFDVVEKPILSIRARMLVVWLVVSGVPAAGILGLNVGRLVGWLPPSSTVMDISTLVLAGICIVAGVRAAVLVTRSITDPVNSLRRGLNELHDGNWETRVPVYDSSELGILQRGFNEMVEGLAERERIRSLFSRHVGDGVAEYALEHGADFSGSKVKVGVLFVDIENSTGLAENSDPTVVAEVLNNFFSIVAEVVERHGGFINKFEGDAALAVFGAPAPIDDPAGSALDAAFDLRRRLTDVTEIGCGIGVSAGTVFAGNIGAESRYEYTVIGDPVNESARLSELAKALRAKVVASAAAVDAARATAAEWSSIGTVELRGRKEASQLFTPASTQQYAGLTDDFAAAVQGALRWVSTSLLLRRDRRNGV